MIEKWGAEQPRITLLLGPLATGRLRYQIAAELVLMYTGKWHTWPRLLTHMDRLYPSILRKIQTADVRLDQGALTVIRKDEALLDPVEKNILATIRKQRELCPLPDIGENVSAFRIADKGACAGLPPAL
jgi:hypothetical protein